MTIAKWIGVGVVVGLVYLLAPILTPFILGALLAYLGDPIVNFLARFKIPRTLGVVIVFLIIIAVVVAALFLLIPLAQKQYVAFMDRLPALIDWVQDTVIPWLNANFNISAKLNVANIKAQLAGNSDKVQDVVTTIMTTATHSTMAIVTFFTNLVLVPVVTFYLLRDWPKVTAGVAKLLPASKRDTIVGLANQCDEVVGAFFKGQLLVMLGLAIVYSTGLWIAGLHVALLIGLISGAVAFIPFMGTIVGILSASIAMYLQTHQLGDVGWVLLVYAIGQPIESTILTPLFVGDRLGLHPVAVIFSVLAGGALFGFFGILVALPVAAVVLVLLRHWFKVERHEGEVSAVSS